MRAGAVRKSSDALRRRRIEHDEVVARPRCTPRRASPPRRTRASRRAPCARTAGRWGCSRWRRAGLRSGAVRVDELVEGALDVGHHRPERRRSVDAGGASARGSTTCSTLPKSGRPSALASRRAGSMVITSVRRPLAAAARPMAADTVVLPTPPVPTQTMTLRPSCHSVMRHHRRRALGERRAALGEPKRGATRRGRLTAPRASRRQARELLLARDAACPRASAARAARPPRPGRRRSGARPRAPPRAAARGAWLMTSGRALMPSSSRAPARARSPR